MSIGGRQGKYIKFDDKMWRILYDDKYTKDAFGLQMVCEDIYDYKIDYPFYPNDMDVPANFDIDNDNVITESDKAVYFYNNMAEILNKECEKVVPNKNYIRTVRILGTNPILDKQDEDTDEYIELNGIRIKKNFYYESDYTAKNGISLSYGIPYTLSFGRGASPNANIKCMYGGGTGSALNYMYIYPDGKVITNFMFNYDFHLIPVVTLKIGALMGVEGDGTEDNPYILK